MSTPADLSRSPETTMPAVLSKSCTRFPYEEVYARQTVNGNEKQRTCITVPLGSLVSSIPAKRRVPPPTQSWDVFAASNNIESSFFAGLLMDVVPQLPMYVAQDPKMSKYDMRVLNFWVLEEECAHLASTLASYAYMLQMANSLCGNSRDEVMERVCLKFRSFVAARRTKDRSDFHCWHCNEPADHGKLCQGWRLARYCSKSCQRSDWLVHKLYCQKTGERVGCVGWKNHV